MVVESQEALSSQLSLSKTLRAAAAAMEEDEPVSEEGQNQQLLQVLEALKIASHELQANPSPKSTDSNFSAIKALLELETEAESILFNDPSLSTLSNHLASLKSTVESLQKSQSHHGLKSFLCRRVSTHEISRVAGSIESEIQAWIDRESIENLARLLNRPAPVSYSDGQNLIGMLIRFVERLSQGFNRELQDLVLKSKIYSELESVLCNSKYSVEVREEAAFAITELIRFNKDVFVGQVLMGETIRSLICMSTPSSLKVICSLIKSVKSPLVDEIDFSGEIANIIDLLDSEDSGIRVMAMNCVLEIGYYGRKESIDAMLKEDLIKKLVELQRSELGGDLIEVGQWEEREEIGGGGDDGGGVRKRGKGESRFLESHPFASCVARFAVQLEVGEGLRQREKRAFKLEILKRVREACVSDAVAATILAEVLWGSSP